MLRFLICLAPLLTASCATVPKAETPTRVMVVSSIHSAHRDHPAYSYDDLFAAVGAFDPEVVAVEIRPEDLHLDQAYLKRNYPFEMHELARTYEGSVVGIDWLGPELQGRPVPENWWKEKSWVKRLEREQAKESVSSTPRLDALRSEQLELVKSSSASALNDGRYDDLTRAYYREFSKLVDGTRYEPLARFYRERDRRIAANVADVVGAHPGKRIAVVLGADHRAAVVDEIRDRFGASLILAPVPIPAN